MTMRGDLLWVSKRLLELSKQVGNDEKAIAEMARASNAGEAFESQHHVHLFFHDLRFAIQWARCGWPQVVPSHKLAASLMATSVAPDAVNDVVFPWPTFAVVVPPGLVKIATVNGRDWEPDSVWLYPSENGGMRLAIRSDDASIVVRDVGSAADLATSAGVERLPGSIESTPEQAESADERNERAFLLLFRLVLGVCIELDHPKHRIVIGQGRPAERREKRGEPKAWTFSLARDVKVDCREWVTSYLRGEKGTKRSVQSLVRGHHKRQAHGPGSALRKWIHVEPYWRGPEDGPIAVRSHVL